jgi:hypothetical protein
VIPAFCLGSGKSQAGPPSPISLTTRAVMMERISFEVHDILADDDRAVILGSLASEFKRTGKIVKRGFAIVLSVATGEIIHFQYLSEFGESLMKSSSQ